MRANNLWATAALLFSLFLSVNAQLTTKCNPTTNTTCPTDVGLVDTPLTNDFTKGENTSWVASTGTSLTWGSQGAEFIIKAEDDAPTITTDFYIFFGYVEVKLKAANGTGIVSSIVLESDDLDEIDWEWLGGNNTSVESNYFGKGNTTSYDRAIYHSVSTPTDTIHTYAIDWTSSSIQWIIDGATVRTLEYADALGGKNFPQTPCKVAIGVWAAGTSSESEGTIEWAGGLTDFSDNPFTMYVESVTIENYNPGLNYKWTDQTGDYTSIEVLNKTSSSNSTTSSNSASQSGSVAIPDGVVSGNSSTISSTGTTASSTTSGTASSFSQNSRARNLDSEGAWSASSSAVVFGIAVWFALL